MTNCVLRNQNVAKPFTNLPHLAQSAESTELTDRISA